MARTVCLKIFSLHLDPTNKLIDDGDDVYAGTRIHIWGHNRDSEPCLLRVEDFDPYFYIVLPSYCIERQGELKWNARRLNTAVHELMSSSGDRQGTLRWLKAVDVKIEWRTPLYFYREDPAPCLKVYFRTLKDMSKCVNYLKSNKLFVEYEESIGRKVRISLELKNSIAEEQDNKIPLVRKLITACKANFAEWIEVAVRLPEDDDRQATIKNEYIALSWTRIRAPSFDVSEWFVRPLKLAIDIETYSHKKGVFPNFLVPEHVVYLVSLIAEREGDPESERKRWAVLMGDCNALPASTPSNTTIIKVANGGLRDRAREIRWMEVVERLIREIDPDIFTGYNIIGFDYQYLSMRMVRMLRNNGDGFGNFSRLRDGGVGLRDQSWESSAYGYNKIFRLLCPGRISIDMLMYMKREPERLLSYKLDAVSKRYLGKQKHDIKADEMFRIYEEMMSGSNRGLEDMTRVILYCIQDSELVLDLFNAKKVWISLSELSNIVQTQIEDLIMNGQQKRCISMLYDMATTNGFVVTRPPPGQEYKYTGGKVESPIVGLHRITLCFDFMSLYPSIMQAFNICYTTLIRETQTERSGLKPYIPDRLCNIINCEQDEAQPEVRYNDEGDVLEDDTEKEVTESKLVSYTFNYIKEEIRKGLIPMIVNGLVTRRRATRDVFDAMDKTEKGTLRGQILDARQLGLKVAANSVYGFLGVKHGYLPLLQAAISVTAAGRQYIVLVQDWLKLNYNAIIVYGDTDSAMVIIPEIKTMKDCSKYGNQIKMRINGIAPGGKDENGVVYPDGLKGILPKHMGIDFEKAMKLFTLTKKKYCALLIDKNGEFKMNRDGTDLEWMDKGNVLARREAVPYMKNIYRIAREKIMMDCDFPTVFEAVYYKVYELWREMLRGGDKIDIHDLEYWKSTPKGNNEESTHFLANFARRMRDIGKELSIGERFGYVMVETTNKKAKTSDKMMLTEDYLEAKERGEPVKLDLLEYLKSLAEPMAQLFQARYGETLNELLEFADQIEISGVKSKTKAQRKWRSLDSPIELMINMLRYKQVDAFKLLGSNIRLLWNEWLEETDQIWVNGELIERPDVQR